MGFQLGTWSWGTKGAAKIFTQQLIKLSPGHQADGLLFSLHKNNWGRKGMGRHAAKTLRAYLPSHSENTPTFCLPTLQGSETGEKGVDKRSRGLNRE